MEESRKRIIFDATSLVPISIGSNLVRPLGGTEVGVIELSKELSKRGHEVIVKSSLESIPETPDELLEYKVRFIAKNQNLELKTSDTVVVVQGYKNVFFYPSNLKIFFWTGDGAEQVSNLGIGDPRFFNRISSMLLASEFHKNSLCQASGFPREKANIIGNGVSRTILGTDKVKKNNFNFIYHVAPYRGLVRLLEIFPSLLKINPNFKLSVYSDMELYRRVGSSYQGKYSDLINRIKEKYKNLEWVNFYPTVTQNNIGEVLSDKSFFIYPANVPETFSMCTAEAMSLGVIPITPNIGALSEVIQEKELVFNSNTTGKEFEEFCVNLISTLNSNPEKLSKLSDKLRSRVLDNLTWKNVADKFENIIFN